MATNKTLAATGVTIQIPEFTDQPDQRVNSNCIDKLADAANMLNSKSGYPMHNANTDRNTESNRVNEIEYLKTNYFNNGYFRAMTRYASGYYHGYLFIGEYGGADSIIIEITHNMTPTLIVWRRNSQGGYSKTAWL